MASIPAEKMERDVKKDFEQALACCMFLERTNPTALALFADASENLVVFRSSHGRIQLFIIAVEKPGGKLEGLVFKIDGESIELIGPI